MSTGSERARRALIVGGGTGLGLACAQALVGDGWRVFLTGRRPDVLASACLGIGERACGFEPGDGTKEGEVGRIVAAAARALGGIDALVISAGRSAAGSVATARLPDVADVLATNLLPLFLFAQAALPHIPDAGGAIVAIASVAGSIPHPERLAYCTSKAGQIGMVRQMALDLAARGIRVNAVSPSLVLTDLSRGAMALDLDPAATLARREGQHPLGRLGTPEEIGAAVAYLCSNKASWVTGQDFVMDGGLSLNATASRPPPRTSAATRP